MKERALVFFTLTSQVAVGSFLSILTLQVAHAFRPQTSSENALSIYNLSNVLLLVTFLLMCASLVGAFAHLGSPLRGWRAIANLNRSWLSREIAFSLLFLGFTGLASLSYRLPSVFATTVFTSLAGGTLCGLALIYCMARVYMQRTVPAWNSNRTLLTFYLTAAGTGLLVVALALFVISKNNDPWVSSTALLFSRSAALVLALQILNRSFVLPRPQPGKLLHPGKRNLSSPSGRLVAWGTAGSLLAAISALLPAVVPGSSWQFPLLALCLALLGEFLARVEFYNSYWRAGI